MDDNEYDEHYWYHMRCRALYYASVMATARINGQRALREKAYLAYQYYIRLYEDSKAESEAIISDLP